MKGNSSRNSSNQHGFGFARKARLSYFAAVQKTAIITCAVLDDEMAHFAKQMAHVVGIEHLEQGLHNEPGKLRRELQAAVDRIEAIPEVEVIVLGYGLCSRGSEGVFTKRCRMVIARAHDCITLLLGSKERYADYVAKHPGTYWYSPGWNKHTPMPGKDRYDRLRREYVEKYGEENADFLMESEQHWFQTYNNAAFVHLGVGDVEKELSYTQSCADWLGWKCDHQCGDPALLKALLAGPWDADRFLVLEPGQTFRMTADERVIEAIPLK
jgi:hypothetical protein